MGAIDRAFCQAGATDRREASNGYPGSLELISATDDMRRRYIKHYFRAEIDDPINYHFVINTGAIGYQETANIIAEATANIQSLA